MSRGVFAAFLVAAISMAVLSWAPQASLAATQNVYDFGGMYGYHASPWWGSPTSVPYVNPATGGASCPPGYTAAQVLGTYRIDNDVYFCYRPHVTGSAPIYDFGGMYGYRGACPAGSGYLCSAPYNNPATGGASCPTGYTSQHVLGTYITDMDLYFCYAPYTPPSICPNGSPAPNGDLLQCQPPPRCHDGSVPPGGDVTKCSDVPRIPQCPSGYVLSGSSCVPGGLCSWSLASFNLSSIFDAFGNQCQDVSALCASGYVLGADNLCHLAAAACPTGQILQNGSCVSACVGGQSTNGVCANNCAGGQMVGGVCTCPANEILQGDTCVSTASASACPLQAFCGQDGNAYEQQLVGGVCSAVLTAQCPWGCSAGVCNQPPQMTVTFRATPLLVRPAGATKLTWSATNAKSCVVTGTNGDSYSGTAGTQQSSPLTGRTTFTFSCTALPNILPASLSQSVTVSVAPTFNEQ